MNDETKHILDFKNKIEELSSLSSQYHDSYKKFDVQAAKIISFISDSPNHSREFQQIVGAYTSQVLNLDSAVNKVEKKLEKYKNTMKDVEKNQIKIEKINANYEKYNNKMSSMENILKEGKKGLDEITSMLLPIATQKKVNSDEISKVLKKVNDIICILIENKDTILKIFDTLKNVGVC